MTAYKTDLAYIHDVGFGRFADDAAPALVKLLRKSGVSNGRVIDLGCGSGILARELSHADYEVIGVDISAAMIRIARKRAPHADFHVASYLKFELPPAAAVTSIGECLNYLFDQDHNAQQLVRLFRRVYDCLEKDGVFVFDVAVPGRGDGTRQRHWESDDWMVVVDVDEDARSRRLTRRITSFRRRGDCFRRDHEVHELRLYERSTIMKELRRIGFRVRPLARYGKRPFPPGLAAFLARKPG